MEEETPGDVRYTAAADWSGRRGSGAHRVLATLDVANAVVEAPVAAVGRVGMRRFGGRAICSTSARRRSSAASRFISRRR